MSHPSTPVPVAVSEVRRMLAFTASHLFPIAVNHVRPRQLCSVINHDATQETKIAKEP